MTALRVWCALLVSTSITIRGQDTNDNNYDDESDLIFPTDPKLHSTVSPPLATPKSSKEESTPGCALPNYSHNKYNLVHCSGAACSLRPGQTVSPNLMVNISCDKDLLMRVRGDNTGFSMFYCASTGAWSKAIPECSIPQSADVRGDEGCKLPDFPQQVKEFSLWKHCRGPACVALPGLMVPHHAVVSIVCNPGHVHAAGYNNRLTCYQGGWLERIPHCAKPCPSVISTRIMKTECFYGGTKYSCKEPMTYNVTARFTCEGSYVLSDSASVTCGEDGHWSPKLPTCEPKCGLSNIKTDSTTTGGLNAAEPGNFPWHAGIYQKKFDSVYGYLCSGTLITPRHIITDSRCVTRQGTTEAMSPKEVWVALGKLGRNWASPESREDRRPVSSINIYLKSEEAAEEDVLLVLFGLENSLNRKVALLALESEVHVNNYVRPVCINFTNLDPNGSTLLSSLHSFVPGWVRDVNCKPGDRCDDKMNHFLQYEYIPTQVKEWDTCLSLMLNSDDKRRAKYNDIKCTGDGKEYKVQMNDPGSGLVYKQNGQYFIMGVFMEEFKEFGSSFGVFSNLNQSSINRWITRTINETTDTNSCKLPDYPNNVYKLSDGCSGLACTPFPGDKLSNYQLITVSCEPGYHMPSSDPFVYRKCERGNWTLPIPQCDNTCPGLQSTSLVLTCYQGPRPVSCDSPQPFNTVVKFQCKEHYSQLSISGNPADPKCLENGTWSRELPTCQPKCGQSDLTRSTAVPTIYGGETASPSNFPWHAAIFHKVNGKWSDTAQCGGSLISPRAILTAAHCVTKASDITIPDMLRPADVGVALGKLNSQWGFKGDIEVNATVEKIIVHDRYRGRSQYFYADIAVLILQSEVEVNSITMPVCIDLNSLHVRDLLSVTASGYVVGWGRTSDCALRGEVCLDYSDELLYTTTPIITFNNCTNFVQKPSPERSPDLYPSVASDKFCSGDGKVSAIQSGDSGGGLVYSDNHLFYIQGVVSNRLKKDGVYSVGLLTNVTLYQDWIADILTRET